MDTKKQLSKRLKKIWEPGTFLDVFSKRHKRPSQTIRKGTIIFNEGDLLNRVYYIKQGFVKIYRLSLEGKETTNYLLGPGYMLGVRALLSKDETAKHTAEAITDLEVVTMSRKEYYDSIIEHPELLVDLVQILLDRLTYTERKVEGFIYASTTKRVANFLYDIAVRFGKKHNKRISLPIDLTHQRIADFVGAFRETVTVSLHTLEKEKILSLRRGSIAIRDIKKLKHFALLGKRNKKTPTIS